MQREGATGRTTGIGTFLMMCAVVWIVFHHGHRANPTSDVLVLLGAIGAILVLYGEMKRRQRGN